jgi:hypothetical protein
MKSWQRLLYYLGDSSTRREYQRAMNNLATLEEELKVLQDLANRAVTWRNSLYWVGNNAERLKAHDALLRTVDDYIDTVRWGR